MNIGIICYGSVGGSGVVATELAKALAGRGHQIHLISSETPFRLGEYQPGLTFHRVDTPAYPLFREPQYVLSLANTIVRVARDFRLDILHAHYAIPHATAAYLAIQILRKAGETWVPKAVTTLHGTDITLLGGDPSYSEAVAFCIEESDGVTAVSESLKADTYRELHIRRDIRVIPNFLDCRVHRRQTNPELRNRFLAGRFDRLVIHVSNFRPVKRLEAVVEVFHRIQPRSRARLLLVGEGPEVGKASRLVQQLGLHDSVLMLGEQDQVLALLSIADVFLLPSAQESFGLAALEAMACEMPVVASRVGGLPEVVQDGVTGFLREPDDLGGMADALLTLLSDEPLRLRMGQAARRTVEQRFCADLIVPQYEAYYREVLASRTTT
ncbi:MAG TPA: N-acetyl-alpha-D-glucosaminyl L-malate synthase BshA [Vicinamibacterales bacterium]|nr:N-acetyl-alpha-D-glucosaminyl L-malate synthase BshA [Vicinamibacterales bacterium]